MEYSFYQLTSAPVEKALPALLEKALSAGMRAVVVARDEPQREVLDKALWTFGRNAILPHGAPNEADAEHQPILLHTSAVNQNDATLLVVLNGDVSPAAGYKRVLYVFDGNQPEALNHARTQWKTLKADNANTLTYWQQDAKGKWEKSA